jgi:hypothetical protein
LIAAGNRTVLDTGQAVAFGDKNFEAVNEFVYLRALVTPVISPEVIFTIHKTLICQVLVHASKESVLTRREEKRLLRLVARYMAQKK